MNIIADIKEAIILYTEINGHYPKKLKLGIKERQRVVDLPHLMNCLNYEVFPSKVYKTGIEWTDHPTQIVPEK